MTETSLSERASRKAGIAFLTCNSPRVAAAAVRTSAFLSLRALSAKVMARRLPLIKDNAFTASALFAALGSCRPSQSTRQALSSKSGADLGADCEAVELAEELLWAGDSGVLREPAETLKARAKSKKNAGQGLFITGTSPHR